MKINKFGLIILFWLCSLNMANANVYEHPATISSFINEIPVMNSISCKFKQEKRLINVEKPLLSSGNFRFVKNQGIYFETLQPIKTTVSYTNKDYKQINDIIQAISNKKYSKIEKEFKFYFEKKGAGWILGLQPQPKSQVSNYITNITITGVLNINKIVIKLKNGNITTLWFMEK